MSFIVLIRISSVGIVNVFLFFFVKSDIAFINKLTDKEKCLMMYSIVSSSVSAKMKVVNSIVGLVSVDVVNDFRRSDFSSDMFLHNKPTPFFISSVNPNEFITSTKELSSKFN